MSKIISGSFVLSAVVDGENAVVYEMIDNGSYFRYNPNTKKVDMQVLGTLCKIEGTKRTPMVGYQIFINDDGNIINDNANDSNYLTTKTDGSFSYTADSEWVDLLSQSTKIHAGFYTNDGLAVLNILKITDGENGMKGERGTPLRVTEWEDGWIYYNGKGANDPYTDVVKYGDYWYLCKTSHRSNQVNHPSGTTENTSNWEAASQFDMIATKVFLAENAHIDLLGSNTIEVKDSSGKATAGMSGGDGVQLWAGGEKESANFRVKKNGDVYVKGIITANALYRGIKSIIPYEELVNGFGYDGHDYNSPILEDFIVIRDTSDWVGVFQTLATDVGLSTIPLHIPDPIEYKGKEILIRNGLARSEDIDVRNVNIRITTPSRNATTGEGYIYDTSGGDSSGINTVVNNTYLETVRMVSDGNYWVVFEKVYID